MPGSKGQNWYQIGRRGENVKKKDLGVDKKDIKGGRNDPVIR